MKQYLQVTYRDIAKMMAAALPIDGEEFGEKVNIYLDAIKAMPTQSKQALKCAYVFSRKVPRQDREDMFQELALALLQAKAEDERLNYAIARRDWQNWWQKYMTRQHFMAGSLNDTVFNSDGEEVELAELVVGEVEFERKMDGHLDAQRIWDKLADSIKPIITKRLLGKALNQNERQTLSRYVRKYGHALI